jgi:xylan 1,4-beta-xylosidase
MTGYRIAANSSGQTPLDAAVANGIRNHTDVGVLASLDGNRASIFVWHYHDDDLPKPDAQVSILVEGLPWNNTVRRMKHYRIDNNHSNAYSKWLAMGSPQNPTKEQHRILQDAGQLTMMEPSAAISVEEGKAVIGFALPIHAVSMIVLENRQC